MQNVGWECLWLEKLEKRLEEEHISILNQEEMLWCQKARSKWLLYGDNNTSYFLASFIIRRKKKLKHSGIIMVTGVRMINRDMAICYYKELFKDEDLDNYLLHCSKEYVVVKKTQNKK